MSGKKILFGTIAGVAVTIGVVTYNQERDRREMKKGVERDKERVRLNKLKKVTSIIEKFSNLFDNF